MFKGQTLDKPFSNIRKPSIKNKYKDIVEVEFLPKNLQDKRRILRLRKEIVLKCNHELKWNSLSRFIFMKKCDKSRLIPIHNKTTKLKTIIDSTFIWLQYTQKFQYLMKSELISICSKQLTLKSRICIIYFVFLLIIMKTPKRNEENKNI